MRTGAPRDAVAVAVVVPAVSCLRTLATRSTHWMSSRDAKVAMAWSTSSAGTSMARRSRSGSPGV